MHDIFRAFFILVAAGAGFVLTSLVLRSILRHVNPGRTITRIPKSTDVGFWIGLSEFVLVLIFVFLGEFTVIAIIFAAKEIVRAEEIRKDAAYYLLGTLLNVALSLLSSLAIRAATFRVFG